MAWRRPGDKPLSEPMMVSLPTHICVTRPQWVNNLYALVPGKYGCDFKSVIFQDMFRIKFMSTCEIPLGWMQENSCVDKSTLVQVMAWCQVTNHYLNQCWPRSLSVHDVTRSQWVKTHPADARASPVGGVRWWGWWWDVCVCGGGVWGVGCGCVGDGVGAGVVWCGVGVGVGAGTYLGLGLWIWRRSAVTVVRDWPPSSAWHSSSLWALQLNKNIENTLSN